MAHETASASAVAAEEALVADVVDIDLTSLLDTTLMTASKREESLLDSLHSANVITREQIERSGARSIPEALRLVPGVIVREIVPGVFDVHLRGFTRLVPSGMSLENASRLVLVMIDQRIVYSDFLGGTLWETLPVSLEDVESIEVVRGPVSALYGLNAVAGVVHIITRRPATAGFAGRASVRAGVGLQPHVAIRATEHGSFGLSYGSGPFSVSLSAMVDRHARADERYFAAANGAPIGVDLPQVFEQPEDIETLFGPLADTADPNGAYPEPKTALRAYATNVRIGYRREGQSDLDVQLRAGAQRSLGHTTMFEYGSTALMMMDSETTYAQLSAATHDLTANVSVTAGKQGQPAVEIYRWRYRTSDALLEYELSFGDTIVRAGLQLRHVGYTGAMFGSGTTSESVLHYAASLRVEQTLGHRIKVVGACRVERNTHPRGLYGPFSLGVTYAVNDATVLRALIGRAFRGPALAELFLDVDNTFGLPARGIGNPDMTLTHVDSAEVGLRSEVLDDAFVEAELFASRLASVYAATGDFAALSSSLVNFSWEPTAIEGRVLGMMVAGGASLGATTARLFATAQHVRLENYAPSYFLSPDEQRSGTDEASPKLYGGFVVNHQHNEALSSSLVAYGFTSQSLGYVWRDIPMRVPTKALLDIVLRYDVTAALQLQLTWKNALLQRTREYGRTDHIGSLVILSARYEHRP